MRRIVVFIACVVLVAFAVVDQASARGGRGGGFHGGGMRGGGMRGGGFRGGAFRGGMRGGAFRGGRGWGGGRVAWRGGRGWRGRGRGWGYWPYGLAAAGLAASYYGDGYYYGDCPLVRRRVATSAGYRLRWVRQC
jgi:hypothetical protein